MTESVSLIPVRAAEVVVGKPLPRAVYDWHGNLLLASGYVIENAAQAAGLLDSGYFQDSSWDAPAKPLPPIQNVNRLVEVTAPPKPETAASEIAINMEDVRWHIGETLYLQLQDKPAMRYSVKLIGFVKGKTIFVTAPTVDGKYELIREGQTFVARAFSGKKAYAFISSAVKSVHTPHPYLHLSYPKQLRCTVVRQTSRVGVRLIAAILLGAPERNAAGTITDLSMGGASVVAKEPLGEKGEAGRIKLKLHVADQDSFLNLKTVLRAVIPAETGQGYRHGFEFVDVPVSDRLILSAFVHQTLVETD
ncbi:c-di-GMP-binding flagellar brake protein YcgR [Actimicrobium sp. GrIS 1.19]|uniref:flagellar brake protein n=1 Tax=Actimicrobium sp. GrIS 1.19 TaxID=3071708 RepID=UPI002DFC0E52|nr:c-di-GMP-binding flagellar brake protein YcgR [Actimicrobium sp. GrIS 1.19]